MKTSAIFLLGILMTSCSESNNIDEILRDRCSESTFIQELTENIPITVKSVKDNEPFYNGSKIYYEVNAEAYLPKIYEHNENKYIRLFPINHINKKIESEIEVKGKITSCLTGDHGLSVNINMQFYLLEQ